MPFLRPIQYHSQADPIWPDGAFKDNFFAYYFLKVHLHPAFSKIISQVRTSD